MPRLSAHEMAALMLLGYAAVEVEVEDLDMTALRDAGLAQRVEREPGRQEYSITREGREVLRVLSALSAPEDMVDRLATPDA
ncbi:hypothetical protein [Paraburkholderia hiiakae]|nr:hypothetical protein [Paraburkholderia hiiakae]